MESATHNLDKTQRRARHQYERVRMGRALVGFLPVFLLVGVVCAFSDHPVWALEVGVVVFLLGATALWYGRNVRRAVLPGVMLGLVPLTLVLLAAHVGHICDGATCTSICLMACVVGGVIAGFSVARSRGVRTLGMQFWVTAGVVAILTGAMGCGRMGFGGIVGIALGYGVGGLPALIGRLLKRA